jgi:glycosyltransferase involved in cell wall biosynthesis
VEPLSQLVTVVVPTFERSAELARALDSLLAQDHPDLEIIVGDNASADDTEAVCQAYAARHPSISYQRQATNVGPTPNFESLRTAGTGGYFMFLGDDDWLDPGYIAACLAVLEADPDASLVAGRTYYHCGDQVDLEPFPISIVHLDKRVRLLSYYRSVRANGVFYGVVPAQANASAPVLRNVQGGDLLHVAALAYIGNVHTIEDVAVHRTVGGMTVNLATVAATLGLGWFQAQAPQLAIAYWVFRDVAWDSPLYADLGRLGRLWLGLRAGWIIFWRFVPKAVVKFVRLASNALWRRIRGPRPATVPPSVTVAPQTASVAPQTATVAPSSAP